MHALPAASIDGAGPALRLVAQDRLRYLDSNAVPPPRVNAFDADSVARVYTIGYGPPPGAADPVHDRDGQPMVLASTPLLDGGDGPLLRHLSGGPMTGCDWLVDTVRLDEVRWQPRPLPRSQPPAQWIPVQLELTGLPGGGYPGEIVDNAARDGWCLPRFTPDVAARIIADTAATPALPPG